MSQQTRNTLQGFFQTGDVPSQTDFSNLIDSFINEMDDQVFVDGNQNVGVGFTQPPARLAVKSVGSVSLNATITLTAGSSQAAVQQIPNSPPLSTLIYPGDVIQVAGTTQLFNVISVVSDSSILLSPNPAAAVTSAQMTLLKNLFFIGNTTSQLVLTNQGNLGIGVALPAQALDVNGKVNASGFIGDGSALLNLTAGNITGQIPAASLPALSFSNIQGQASISQLPALSFSNIQGQISASQLPSGIGPGANGIISFVASYPIVQSGSGVTLSWITAGIDLVVLNFLENYQLTTVSSLRGAIAVSPGTYILTPDITQIVTLSAYQNNVVVSQSQLTITVIPSIQSFMQNCFSKNIQAQPAVTAAAIAFDLGILCASNVSLLAIGMNGIYPVPQIYQAIPAYYISLNYTWNANTNANWINAVLFPNS